jgi:hypothetical protein
MLMAVGKAAPGRFPEGLYNADEGEEVAVICTVVVMVLGGGSVGLDGIVVWSKSRKKACRKASLADSLDCWS